MKRIGHTCVDQPHLSCAKPECGHIPELTPERSPEWFETEYGKYYMDTQRHEGKV